MMCFNDINSLHVIAYTKQRSCTHQNYVVSNEELSLILFQAYKNTKLSAIKHATIS